MLTFSKEGKNTRAIALVKGGKYNDKIIYLNPDLKKESTELVRDYAEYSSYYDDETVKIPRSINEMKIIKEINKLDGKKISKKQLDKIINKTEREMDDVIWDGKYFLLNPMDNSTFKMVPNIKRNELISAFAKAGGGKSTFANGYSELYRDIFPDNPIYFFSRIDEDNSIDDKKLDITRIKLDQDFVDFKIDYTDLYGSLCIFDDIDGIENMYIDYGDRGIKIGKALLKKVIKTQNDIIRLGREHKKSDKGGIYSINIRHILFDYQQTRILLNGSTHIVIFPKFINPVHLEKYYDSYLPVDSEMKKKLANCRYFIHCNLEPQYIMTEKFIYVI